MENQLQRVFNVCKKTIPESVYKLDRNLEFTCKVALIRVSSLANTKFESEF